MKGVKDKIIVFLLILLVLFGIFISYKAIEYAPTYFDSDFDYIFDKGLAQELASMYKNNPYEYSACIEGNFQGETMEEVYFLDINNILTGTETKVDTVLCDSIGMIHSHPSGTCIGKLNGPDAEAAKVEFRNGVSFFIIQCSEDTFEVYDRENLYEGKTIEI